MSFPSYKYCIVPQCESSTLKTPNKLFFNVPNTKQIRHKWLKLARRKDFRSLAITSKMYFCEDHFDLPNDMENYMEYQIMGVVSKVLKKPGCTPSKFHCQEDRRKRTCGGPERPYITKKKRMMAIAECLRESEDCNPSSSFNDKDSLNTSNAPKVEENILDISYKQTADKSVQAFITHKFRSKAVQTNVKLIDQALSPLKPSLISSATSPFKVTIVKSSPSISGLSKIRRNLFIKEEHSDSDTSLCASFIAVKSHSDSQSNR